jgi:hypothetical protein
MDRVEQMKCVQKEGLELFERKNKDYGDAFAQYGTIGVLMRIEDKIKRAMNITKNGIQLVNDECIRDTLIDLHNYAAMGIMLLDEEEKEDKDEKNEKHIPDNIDEIFVELLKNKFGRDKTYTRQRHDIITKDRCTHYTDGTRFFYCDKYTRNVGDETNVVGQAFADSLFPDMKFDLNFKTKFNPNDTKPYESIDGYIYKY